MAGPTFEASFAKLLAAWGDYQLVPRRPDDVSELGAARWRLDRLAARLVERDFECLYRRRPRCPAR